MYAEVIASQSVPFLIHSVCSHRNSKDISTPMLSVRVCVVAFDYFGIYEISVHLLYTLLLCFTDVSRTRRFPYKTFPGQSLSRTDVSRTSYTKEFSCT